MSSIRDVRKRRANGNADRDANGATPQASRSLAWRVLLIAAVAVGALSSFYVFDRFVWARIPAAIVGKWGVDGGVQDGATLYLNREGTYQATVNLRGSEGTVKGRLEAGAKHLTFISVNPASGKEESLQKVIEHISPNEMLLRDPSGQVTRLVRLD